MGRTLKVFVGNYDGRLDAMVAATSQRAAADAVGTSLYDFRQYYSEVGPSYDGAEIAIANAGTVYIRKSVGREPWEMRA